MNRRAFLAALPSAGSLRGAASDFLDPEYWRNQGLAELIPNWYAHARDLEYGAFHTTLSREWKPVAPFDKMPAMIGRQVFGFSAAYLLSGDERYRSAARDGVEYLMKRCWDAKYGGWFDRLSRSGEPLETSKSAALQLYTDAGLTMYSFVFGDAAVLARVRESVAIRRTRGRDPEFGGCVQQLGRDLGVLDWGKNKHAHYGYVGSLLLNLYLATGDADVLAFSRELTDLSLGRMRDRNGWLYGFQSRFDRRWNRTPNVVNGVEMASVGAQLTGALSFLRLWRQTGDAAYRDAGVRLGELCTRYGCGPRSGAWLDEIASAPPHGPSPKASVEWWVQIYGAFLQLHLFDATGDRRHLETFRRSESFFERYFHDRRFGGIVASVAPDGAALGDMRKAGPWQTSYHEMEHALLNYVYLSLYVHRRPAVLHFRGSGPAVRYVSPADNPAVRIGGVTVDGQPWKRFDAGRRTVESPDGADRRFVVTLVR